MDGVGREKRGPIRVLVIDDSAFSRQTITRMLETSPLVEVVGSARDGEEALRKTLSLEPDLITLDLEMPRMDGFTFLRLIMAKRRMPVLIISGQVGEQDVFRALDLGAVDFIAKPTTRATPELRMIQDALIRKVHAIRELRVDNLPDRIRDLPEAVPVSGREDVPSLTPTDEALPIVVLGASTGGPVALLQVLAAFAEKPRCAFLIAQHMPEGFTHSFAERLDRLTALRVREASGGERPEAGLVLVAPGGAHLSFEGDMTRIESKDRAEKYTPSVDRLFSSAAKNFGERTIGVILTGMGNDGREGACQVKAAGGRVIAESEETAVIYGMPKQVVNAGVADAVLPLGEIPRTIGRWLEEMSAPGSGMRGRS